MKIFTLIALLCSSLLAGCVSNDQVVDNTLEVQGGDFSLTKKWETSGFKMPESVFASPEHPWLYISNVNGAEPGFISRVAKDGTIDDLEWVTGLISPTGSDLYKNKLYVADAKQLHAIDVSTGEITNSYSADSAISLNDVAIDQKTGDVYVSDVPGGKVYRLKDGELTVWFESSEIPYPNGVLVQGDYLLVANYATKNGKGLMRQQWGSEDLGTLYKVDIKTKALFSVPSSVQKGGYDGVVEFRGVLMASSNPTGQIITFEGDKSYLIDSTDRGIADINTDGQTIYAPYLFNNKLIAFEPVAWDRIKTKKEYLEKGADNYYGDAAGKSIATHDGIIKGLFGGQKLTGTWNWEGEYFCRTSMLGKMDLGSDCIQIDVTDNKMRLILNKGKGMSVVYDKKNDTTIQMIGRFHLKSEGRAKFKSAMLEVVNGTVNEPGAQAIRMFEDKKDSNLLFGYERFNDFSAVEDHRKQPYELALIEVAGTTLVAPPVAYVFGPAITQELRASDERKIDPSELYVVALFDIKPNQFDRVVEQYKKQIPNVRKHEGNISFNAYSVIDNPTQLVVVEWWKSAEVARGFSTNDSLSIETGKILTESLERPIPEYLHELREVNP